jgi:PAS domain S-box-containing protein
MDIVIEHDLINILASVTIETSEVVIITDLNENIVWVNDGFTYLTGYTHQEAIGKKPNMLQGPNTNKETCEKLRNAIKDKNPINIDIVNYSKKGNPYWVKLNIKPYKKNNEVVGFVAVETDMTEYYSPHSGETVVSLRNNNMHAEIISHDSINLLSNIIYNTQEIKDILSLKDNKVDSILDNIIDITEQVVSMLQELMTCETSDMNIDVSQLINQCVKYYSHRCDQKKIQIVTNLFQSFITFPKNHMITIINTLVSNAIKFTENGTITITLSNDGYKLTVADTGIGIPSEQINKLFLYNTHREGTIGETGKGIGLILLYKLINKYNGKIHVDSIVGKGTSITVTLPCISP